MLPVVNAVLHSLNVHNPSPVTLYNHPSLTKVVQAAPNRTSFPVHALPINRINGRKWERVIIKTCCMSHLNHAAAERRRGEIDIYLVFEAPAQLQSQIIND